MLSGVFFKECQETAPSERFHPSRLRMGRARRRQGPQHGTAAPAPAALPPTPAAPPASATGCKWSYTPTQCFLRVASVFTFQHAPMNSSSFGLCFHYGCAQRDEGVSSCQCTSPPENSRNKANSGWEEMDYFCTDLGANVTACGFRCFLPVSSPSAQSTRAQLAC